MSSICIQALSLKNFRCFQNATFSLDAPVVLIEGSNGSGKTSLLEALHYLCYVRSFRTHTPKDLIAFEKDTFFIAATLQEDELTVGVTGTKRQVKINKKPITSYAQLRAVCRVVTVTQEDLEIVKASPEKRRSFLDHALALHDPHSAELLKTFRQILEMRNAFLMRGTSMSKGDEFALWTQKLWESSRHVQAARKIFLDLLLAQTQKLSGYFLDSQVFSLTYRPKEEGQFSTYQAFWDASSHLFERECFMRRSLFGAHLDELEILFRGKPARIFSSRGQQKLLTLFLKIAQVTALTATHGPVIFLLDDFLSDFDSETLSRVLKICLTLRVQLIITTPLSSGPELTALKALGCDPLKISI